VSYELLTHVVSTILLLCTTIFRFKQCDLHAYMDLIFVKTILENYDTDNWIDKLLNYTKVEKKRFKCIQIKIDNSHTSLVQQRSFKKKYI